jgi:hypothetical protein
LRDKEEREVDFLITSNCKPWRLAECKLSDKTPAPTLAYFARVLRSAMTGQVIARLACTIPSTSMAHPPMW